MSISRFLREGTWPKKVFHEAIFKPSIKGLIFVSFPLIYQCWCWLHCWIISDLALRYLLMSRLTECSLIDSTFWFWLILSKLSFSIRRSWAWGLGLGAWRVWSWGNQLYCWRIFWLIYIFNQLKVVTSIMK